MHRRIAILSPVIFSVAPLFAQPLLAQAAHSLKPTPKMLSWGYYDAKAAPVLRVKSGDAIC